MVAVTTPNEPRLGPVRPDPPCHMLDDSPNLSTPRCSGSPQDRHHGQRGDALRRTPVIAHETLVHVRPRLGSGYLRGRWSPVWVRARHVDGADAETYGWSRLARGRMRAHAEHPGRWKKKQALHLRPGRRVSLGERERKRAREYPCAAPAKGDLVCAISGTNAGARSN
jgi:hypothetical protein